MELVPRGTYQNNSCYNNTLDNRWQLSYHKEETNIDCSSSAVQLTGDERCYVPRHISGHVFQTHICGICLS